MDTQLKAFLDLLAWSEATSTHPLTMNDGYDVIVTGVGGMQVFTDYADHPFAHGGSVVVRHVPLLVSTAAGRYQLLARYWNIYRVRLHLSDFSPPSQDAVAVQQIKERGAIPLILSCEIEQAINKCSNIWASLPDNHYGQGGKTMDELLEKYNSLIIA